MNLLKKDCLDEDVLVMLLRLASKIQNFQIYKCMILYPLALRIGQHMIEKIRRIKRMRKIREVKRIEGVREVKTAIAEIK